MKIADVHDADFLLSAEVAVGQIGDDSVWAVVVDFGVEYLCCCHVIIIQTLELEFRALHTYG